MKSCILESMENTKTKKQKDHGYSTEINNLINKGYTEQEAKDISRYNYHYNEVYHGDSRDKVYHEIMLSEFADKVSLIKEIK